MRTNYRKIAIVLTIAALMVVILTPLLIKAENRQGGKGFCDRLSSAVSQIDQRLDSYINRLQEKRNEIRNRISERREGRNNRFEEKRQRWETNRTEHFEELEKRAGTDAEKLALANFKSKISQAIIERRAAVEKAISDFREGVDDLKAGRKSSIDDLIIDYKEDIKVALDKAQTVCESGSQPATVVSNLRSELKQIKDDFVSARKNIDNISEEMNTLIAAKKEAIKDAQDNFREKMEQALADLKAQFPELEEEIEESDDNDEEENE